MPPALSPGSGFSGPVAPSPAGPIGSGRGDDATAIARWIDNPYQTRSGTIVIGFPAFHLAGIDYVEYSLDAGTIVSVDTMTAHPVTGIRGYWVQVDCDALDDGEHEIQGNAYPNLGYPRSLAGPLDNSTAAQQRGEHSYFFYTNFNTTLPELQIWIDVTGSDAADGSFATPMRTVSAAFVAGVAALGGDPSGLIITMKSAGSYGWPNTFTIYTNGRPVILEGRSTLAKTDCVLDTMDANPPRGFQCRHVLLRNCTVGEIHCDNDSSACLLATKDVVGAGTDYNTQWAPFLKSVWAYGLFHEDIVFHDMNTAALEANMIRGYEIYNIGEDCLRECAGANVDGYCHDVRQPVPNHSNVIQHSGGQIQNVLYYGLTAFNIGIDTENPDGLLIRNLFAVPAHRDLAFVNVNMHSGGNCQILHSANHVLIWYCTIGSTHEVPGGDQGGSLFIHDDPPDSPNTLVANLSIRNSFCKSFGVNCTTDPVYAGPGNTPNGTEVWADNNHFIDNIAGTNNTTGETEAALFNDPTLNDWTPKITGTLAGRVATPLVPDDATKGARVNLGAISALEQVGVLPPDLADSIIPGRYQLAVNYLANNTGGPVTSAVFAVAGHVPIGLSVSVEAATAKLSGIPVPV